MYLVYVLYLRRQVRRAVECSQTSPVPQDPQSPPSPPTPTYTTTTPSPSSRVPTHQLLVLCTMSGSPRVLHYFTGALEEGTRFSHMVISGFHRMPTHLIFRITVVHSPTVYMVPCSNFNDLQNCILSNIYIVSEI